MKLEIWVTGTLNIATLFMIIAIINLCVGGYFISWLSNGYLDSLFFFHLFSFCTVVMIHKYWLSICNDEAECTFLVM